MILMWLGSFVLLLFSLAESQNILATFFQKLQKEFLSKGFRDGTLKSLARALDLVILEASPQKTVHSGLALYNLRVLDLRPSLLLMCLSPLGAWWALLLGLLFLGFNGFFILAFALPGFVRLGIGPMPRLKMFSKFIFLVGMFLLGSELILKNASILGTLLGHDEAVYFLVDGRFQSVVILLVLSILLSFFIEVEFWSLLISLTLIASGLLSINGALGLFLGERICRALQVGWRSRSLTQDCSRLGRQFTGIAILGAVIGFFVVGEVRSYVSFDGGISSSALQDKLLLVVLMFSGIIFSQFLALMSWGHFASGRELNEPQVAQYIPPSWFTDEILSATFAGWAKEKVNIRLNEIRYHLQGLGTLKENQVPGHIEAQLKEEERQLTSLVREQISTKDQ